MKTLETLYGASLGLGCTLLLGVAPTMAQISDAKQKIRNTSVVAPQQRLMAYTPTYKRARVPDSQNFQVYEFDGNGRVPGLNLAFMDPSDAARLGINPDVDFRNIDRMLPEDARVELGELSDFLEGLEDYLSGMPGGSAGSLNPGKDLIGDGFSVPNDRGSRIPTGDGLAIPKDKGTADFLDKFGAGAQLDGKSWYGLDAGGGRSILVGVGEDVNGTPTFNLLDNGVRNGGSTLVDGILAGHQNLMQSDGYVYDRQARKRVGKAATQATIGSALVIGGLVMASAGTFAAAAVFSIIMVGVLNAAMGFFDLWGESVEAENTPIWEYDYFPEDWSVDDAEKEDEQAEGSDGTSADSGDEEEDSTDAGEDGDSSSTLPRNPLLGGVTMTRAEFEAEYGDFVDFGNGSGAGAMNPGNPDYGTGPSIRNPGVYERSPTYGRTQPDFEQSDRRTFTPKGPLDDLDSTTQPVPEPDGEKPLPEEPAPGR